MTLKPTCVFVLLATACAVSSSALAQTSPPAHPQQAQLQKRWADADLDKDGQLTKAEAQVAGLRWVVEHFDALDTNKDGKLSPEEARAGMQKRHGPMGGKPPEGAKPDAKPDQKSGHKPEGKPDGKPDAKDPRPGAPGAGAYKSPEERRAAMDERFKKADANGDGALSKAEVQAAGNTRMLEHFDAIDANKDGKITPEELRNFWQQRQGGPRK